MNTKSLLAITAIPLLGLGIFMATKTPTVQTDTNVERQEFSVVEKKAIDTEIKVAKVDSKVEELAKTQDEQAKQIETVKAEVQQVKTVYVQAPAPEPIKVEAKIDYDKLILDKAMTKEGFGTDKKNSYSFGTKTKRSFFLLKAGENTWYWSTVGSSYVPANKMTDVQALAWLDTIN
jgi:NADH dehydrogenase FAD-containing subunit